MIRSLWISKTGLDAQQVNLDVISNNLANVSTTGYKRVQASFDDLMYQTLRTPGTEDELGSLISTGLQVGNGSKIGATQRMLGQGTLLQSQNPLDVAVNGPGYFSVETAQGVAYTRKGNFTRSASGQIVSTEGHPLLSTTGTPLTIPVQATSIQISADGQVSYLTAGNVNAQTVGQIAVTHFINPAGLIAQGGGLFRETAASGAPQVQVSTSQTGSASTLSQYFTEQSNVNVAEELVQLIAAQRAYEIAAKGVTASDQMLQKLAQL